LGLAALSAWGLCACDAKKVAHQLTADELMVGTLLAVPPVSVSPAAMAGVGSGNAVNVPGETTVFVFFGRKKGTTGFDEPPEPIADAQVSLRADGGTVSVPSTGAGTYTQTSIGDSKLVYQSGATYEFVAVTDDEFVGEVPLAPAIERVEVLHPAQGYLQHPANTALTLTRPAVAAGAQRAIAWVTVVPLESDGSKGEATYSNAPKTPLDFLKLVAASDEWRQATVTVPASAFPSSATVYLVIFQSAKLGGPKSDNLFTGSALLAGTSDVGVVRTP
jgi:hypothetical protein